MALKYLSEDWAKEVNNRLQASEALRNAAKGQSCSIQQVLTDVPEGGEKRYYFKVDDGAVELGLGDVPNPDATITQSYETAVAIETGRIGAQAAFMQGKLQVSGNLIKVMSLQTVFQTLPGAIGQLEREY